MTLAEEGHHVPLTGCLRSELPASPDPLCSASLPCSVSWETDQDRPMNCLPCSLALGCTGPVGSTMGDAGEGGERGQGIYSPGSFLGVLPGELVAFLEPPGSPYPTAYWVSAFLFFFFLFAPAGLEASLLVSNAGPSWRLLVCSYTPCLFLYT